MITNEIIDNLVNSGLITKKKHPKYDIWILNYTPEVQFDKLWTEELLMCRGLVIDSNANIVARPFKKFFNHGEDQNLILPNEQFDIWIKMDGSLGILFFHNEWIITTRGSFESDQAIHATEVLYTKYSHLLDKLNKEYTYCFEIIY